MRHTLTLPHTRTVSRSLSLSVVRALHRCLRGLEHVCFACAVFLAPSRFREILSNLRASGSRYQYAGDSRNFRETWDVCFSHLADAFVQSDVQGREYSSYEQ